MPKKFPTKRLAKKKLLSKRRAVKKLATKQLAKKKLAAKRLAGKSRLIAKTRANSKKASSSGDEGSLSFAELREMSIRTSKNLNKVGVRLDKVGEDLDKFKATAIEQGKNIDKLKETVGVHDRKWGELTEALTVGDARALFGGMGIELQKMGNNMDITSPDGKIAREIDGLAVGKDAVVVMEVKTSLSVRGVNSFIKQTLAIYTKIDPDCIGKKIYGAVGYLKASSQAVALAHQNGLFVIRSRHDVKELVTPPRGFKPRNFHP